MECDGCVNSYSIFCKVCNDKEFYMNAKQKAIDDRICDLLSGGGSEDGIPKDDQQ